MQSGRDMTITTPIADRSHHIFFPYFGGADDRVALRFILQLAQNPKVTATVIHISTSEVIDTAEPEAATVPPSRTRTTDSVEITTSAISTADPSMVLDKERDTAFFVSLRDSLPSALSSRVVFESLETTHSARETLSRAQLEVGQSPKNAGDLVVIGRRGHVFAERELAHLAGGGNTAVMPERRKCLGEMAELILTGRVRQVCLLLKLWERVWTFDSGHCLGIYLGF